jgi:endoglucanase
VNGELSYGLARLATLGNRIVNRETGQPALLRGVNRSGLEYTDPDEEGFLSPAGMTHFEMRWLATDWKCNIVRLPVNQDFALRGRGPHSGEVYLRDVDRVISWAARYGIYTLLDLQWLDADTPFGPNRQFVPPLPNPDTPRFWQLLARRYRDEPAVLFDILNEPHDREPLDPYRLWKPGGTQYPLTHYRVSMAEWQPWARVLIDAIRAEAPEALIFVSGTNWAYDLRGFPLEGRANLVYSTHVYANKGTKWEESFGVLARTHPVFAGEWGGNEFQLDWGRRLSDYFDELGIGWTVWSWWDWPYMMTRFEPTRFGAMVRHLLMKSAP